jgi:integrase/recombinase XerD
LQPNHFRKRLSQYAKQAGIKKHVHPHLIRHSTATMYLEGGGNLRYLQALLGHVDQRMTARYTHLSKQAIADNHEQYSALNQVIGSLNKPRKIKR